MKNNNNEVAYPDTIYAWYVVAILFLAYTVSFIDRQIMTLLIEPIKRDLQINDTSISLLHGLAFVIFYTIMSIPLGRLADNKNRKVIISIGILIWSFMTAVCGLAKTFWTLFAARIGVGVGEASLSPSAYSMIADYFPQEKRSFAVSLYSMGIFFGSGIAYIVGGAVVQMASQSSEIILPLAGEIRPWQLAFFIAGIPGLIVVALMTTVKEPFRRDLLAVGTGDNHMSIKATISYLVQRWQTYTTLIIGFSLMATLSYGFFTWIPSMFIRTFNWTAPEIAFRFGLIVLLFGTSGIVYGGALADKFLARGKKDAFFRVAMIAAVGVTGFGVTAVLLPNPTWVLILLIPTVFFLGFAVGTGPAAMNYITPNQIRGQGIAIFYFILNIMGLGLGPLFVASFTDYVFKDPLYLRYSLAVFTIIVGVSAFVILWAGRKPYCSSVDEFFSQR
ncbi:MAG: MFS transporter [Gammaproteobacteria bacterium]|nr:MFS transporter [Gammaproteobacteria bacterium]